MSLTITAQDLATPKLAELMAGLRRPRGLHATMASRVAVRLRRHYAEKNQSSPNAKGFPRQNFWNRFRNVTSRADDEGAVVTIPDPQGALRHKVSGGTITPKRGRALFIPLSPEAYKLSGQARMRDAFPDAFLFRGKKRLFLARPGSGKKGKGSLRILGMLVPKVTHRADPTALPPEADLRSEAITGANNYLTRLLARKGGQS
jgi:hypothetical protein